MLLLLLQVHDLRDVTQKVEGELQDAEAEMRRQEDDIARLRGRLRHLSSTDSLYVSQLRSCTVVYRITCDIDLYNAHVNGFSY